MGSGALLSWPVAVNPELESAGPAHVATVSFLASRAVPSGGFAVALAGGTALARVGARLGVRQGFGASIAAMLETVAIMGPARFGVPLTQAVGAPLLGGMHAKGRGVAAQVAVAALIRLVSNTAGASFFIFVITGGLDAYSGTYENIAGRLGIELGQRGTIVATAVALLLWTAVASVAQVLVYRRGLNRWPEGQLDGESQPVEPYVHRGRFDPRVAALATAGVFGLLLASTAWVLLGGVVAWLSVSTALARGDRRAWRTGFALAGVLAVGAIVFSLTGGLGIDVAARRGLRAGLLVLAATWLRAAAGADGLREVSRRALARLKRLPAVSEAARVLDSIGSEGRLVAAGKSMVDRAAAVPFAIVPLVDAMLGWAIDEAGRYRPPPVPPVPPALALRARAVDALLVVAAALPGLVLVV